MNPLIGLHVYTGKEGLQWTPDFKSIRVDGIHRNTTPLRLLQSLQPFLSWGDEAIKKGTLIGGFHKCFKLSSTLDGGVAATTMFIRGAVLCAGYPRGFIFSVLGAWLRSRFPKDRVKKIIAEIEKRMNSSLIPDPSATQTYEQHLVTWRVNNPSHKHQPTFRLRRKKCLRKRGEEERPRG